MKDKEQIIIDGIDVSECEYVCNTAFGNIGCKLPFNEEIHCCKNPNCYFKKLARKTQECEELKKQLMQKSEVDMFFNTPIEGWSNDPCGICPHKAENEELKKELDLYKTWYRAKHSDVKNTLGRYHKALKEIEEVCLEDTYTFADGTQIRYDSLDDILNIINKAKDGK